MMVSKIQNKKLKKEEITIWRFVRQSVYDDDNIRQIEFSLFLSRMEDGAKKNAHSCNLLKLFNPWLRHKNLFFLIAFNLHRIVFAMSDD